MRDMLIEEVHRLAETVNYPICDDLRTWSNKEILQLYGDLRVEEEFGFYYDEN
jgi:hypothetical protein